MAGPSASPSGETLAPATAALSRRRPRPSRALRLFQAGTFAASTLPPGVTEPLAEVGTVVASRSPMGFGLRQRRRMLARHLRRVCGDLGPREINRLVDQAFASYARYWAESLRLPHLDLDQVAAGIVYDGFDRIQASIDAGRGTILAVPHLGGWEWAGTHLARTVNPVSVVVERLEPPDLFEWFASFRERLGMRVIPVGPRAGSQCLQALGQNHILCLLSDRIVPGTGGVEVCFFGENTQLPAGPATLAMRSGATLLPAAVYFEQRPADHLAIVREPVNLERSGRLRDDVQAATQRLAAELEVLIRRAPTQWHLMQPNWPSDEGGAKGPGPGPE